MGTGVQTEYGVGAPLDPPAQEMAPQPNIRRTASVFVFGQDERVACVLSNVDMNACPFLSDEHVEDLSGLMTYTFTCPADHPDTQYLVKTRQVLIYDLDGLPRLFRITKVVWSRQGANHVVTVSCENAAQELVGDPMLPVTFKSATVATIVGSILAGTRWEPGDIEDDGIWSTGWRDFSSKFKALVDLQALTGLEAYYRVEFSGLSIVHRYVDFKLRLGHDTGKVVEYGKDLNGITRTDDGAVLATALVGLGRSDSLGVYASFKDIAWHTGAGADTTTDYYNKPLDKPKGQYWLEDPDATAKWGPSPDVPVILTVNFADETSPEAILEKTYALLQTMRDPNPTYEIDVAFLEKAFAVTSDGNTDPFGQERMRLGDTLIVRDPTFYPPVFAQLRVTRTRNSYSGLVSAPTTGA